MQAQLTKNKGDKRQRSTSEVDDHEDSNDEPQQQPVNVPPPTTSTPPMPQGAFLEAIMAQLQLIDEHVNVIMDTQLAHGQIISSMTNNIDNL
nr:hypothetical protein CFP56_60823 [Quercus suber]